MTLPRGTALGWTRKKGGLILRESQACNQRGLDGAACMPGGHVPLALGLAHPVLWAETWGNVMPSDLPKLEEIRW